MRLLTKTLERRFAKIGSQENAKDPLIIVKFFNPAGAGTWYATEYDPNPDEPEPKRIKMKERKSLNRTGQ